MAEGTFAGTRGRTRSRKNSAASVFLLVLHRYRLHSPFLPSIIQTKTKQFLQLEITLVILCFFHSIVVSKVKIDTCGEKAADGQNQGILELPDGMIAVSGKEIKTGLPAYVTVEIEGEVCADRFPRFS